MSKEMREKRLLNLFLDELDEHRAALSRDLLKLEGEVSERERPALIENMFRSAHSLKGASRSVQIPSIERVCHRLEQHFQDLRGHTAALPEGLVAQLFTELDLLHAEATKLSGQSERAQVQAGAPAGERDKTPVTPPADGSQAAPQAARKVTEKRALRVSAEKTDALLARATDLLTLSSTLQGQLGLFDELKALCSELGRESERGAKEKRVLSKLSSALDHHAESFARGVHAVVRGSERLDEEAQRLRLVPFSEACEGLDRATRDLALAAGKSIELSIESNDVEIDRAIAQRLRDPLLHLLRNAVIHGIESEAERRAQAKPELAKICIAAALFGKSVDVTFSDDGRGFDLARIRSRAESMRLDTSVSERELLRYTFLPGFSTAHTVTEIAGRGVGLDAVERAVEAIHGNIEVKSEAGRGARFVLRLPLTLSKLRCVFARAGARWYAIPAAQVLRVARFADAQIVSLDGRKLLNLPEGLLPLSSLGMVLGLAGHEASSRLHTALVLAGEGRPVALIVDELGEEREITARALPARLSGARQVSSATLLGMGRVALVLNPQDLCRRALLSPVSTHGTHKASVRTRPRVLIAEDSATTRAVLKSVLEEAHYDVTTAQDGEEAFTLLQQRPFDLVLSDVQMPHKDGISLTESIRQHERLARLPVVLMTSLENETDRLRGLRAGASAYLTKSGFDHQTLLETVAALL
jgi:two-component system, chemotaxis family, sensor kinase CheA